MSETGTVHLVGAGPGDLGLVTARASELVASCDVVVFDNLVNPALLEQTASDCELIDVGKEPGRHALPQEEITEILVTKAREGKRVVRLKGGDPFVFGRGGEEMMVLEEANVPFEIVPGVTAALGCAAYAGIPLTRRDLGSSISFLTGHEDVAKKALHVDFGKFAAAGGTLCIYMGMGKLEEIVTELRAGGLSGDMPVAVVRQGTLSTQRKIISTLDQVAGSVREAGFKAPAVIFVGSVVGLARESDWFSARPLFGKRIVVTRARAQSGKLSALLEKAGAEVLELPLVQVVPEVDQQITAEVFAGLATYEWIVFTSVNGAREFFELFFRAFEDLRSLGPARIACVGKATAEELTRLRLQVDLVPEKATAEDLAKAMIDTNSLDSANVLVVTGTRNRDVLVEMLDAIGHAIVDVLQVYATDFTDLEGDPAADEFCREGADAIVFASSSAVDSYLEQEDDLRLGKGARNPIHCSIGPATSRTLRENELSVDLEAPKASLSAVVETLVDHFAQGAK
ncbi:MAG: uroporphyrinogen-III C-methyltransferase [Opitutales bacterium]|nr:uroporphyrinogen-III C-methyltransferase [Opitutales bacterium]